MATEGQSDTTMRLEGASTGASILGDRRFAFVASLVIGSVAWQLIGMFVIDPELISTPVLIVEETIRLFNEDLLVHNMWLTLQRTFYAMVVTIIVGTVVGLLAGWNEFWRGALQDYILTGLSAPTLLAAIFAAIWFGTSPLTPIVAASILSFPFLAQNVKEAVENLDADLVEMSQSFDVSRDRYVRRVVIMAVLPEWFSGMRNAFTVAWKIVTIAEFVGFSNGVGFHIVRSFELFSMSGVLAWTLSFSLIIIAIEFALFEPIERRIFSWRRESTMSFG